MSKRKTHLDKAIEQLEGERAVIDAAIAKLKEQQQGAMKPPTVQDVTPGKAEPRA